MTSVFMTLEIREDFILFFFGSIFRRQRGFIHLVSILTPCETDVSSCSFECLWNRQRQSRSWLQWPFISSSPSRLSMSVHPFEAEYNCLGLECLLPKVQFIDVDFRTRTGNKDSNVEDRSQRRQGRQGTTIGTMRTIGLILDATGEILQSIVESR